MIRSNMRRALVGGIAALGMALSSTAAFAQASAPTPAPAAPRGGLTQERMDELAHKHDGYLGALAPENLAKPRPAPPFNLTGVWFVDLRRAFSDFMFGPPYPEFFEPGQTAMKEAAEARAKGVPYRDMIGQCWPAGMPMITTRVWPVGMIQLPTVIWVTYAFNNGFRAIYLDGREHLDPDIAVPTYNGDAVGKWEGDTLVVTSKNFATKNHYIDQGIPISDQFQLVERMKLKENGTILEVEFIMTDPKMWKGEWRSTKRWIRQDYSDIPEVECLPDLNDKLPSTAAGQAAIEKREGESK